MEKKGMLIMPQTF